MKIRPLNNLISGLTGYGADAQSTQQATAQKQAATVAQANDDAASVQVAKVERNVGSDRAAYVASLKEQVQSGSYKRDSEQVAEALYRDLF